MLLTGGFPPVKGGTGPFPGSMAMGASGCAWPKSNMSRTGRWFGIMITISDVILAKRARHSNNRFATRRKVNLGARAPICLGAEKAGDGRLGKPGLAP